MAQDLLNYFYIIVLMVALVASIVFVTSHMFRFLVKESGNKRWLGVFLFVLYLVICGLYISKVWLEVSQWIINLFTLLFIVLSGYYCFTNQEFKNKDKKERKR